MKLKWFYNNNPTISTFLSIKANFLQLSKHDYSYFS